MISIWVVVRNIEYPLRTGGQLRRTEWMAYTCTAVDSIACVFYVYIVKTIAERVWWMSNYVMETPGNESDSQLRSLHFKLPSCILVGTSILCQMHVRAYNWECRSCTQSCPCPWFSVLNVLCVWVNCVHSCMRWYVFMLLLLPMPFSPCIPLSETWAEALVVECTAIYASDTLFDCGIMCGNIYVYWNCIWC